MTIAIITAIGTAAPDHDIHDAFCRWAAARLTDPRERTIFLRMAARAGIERRDSVLPRVSSGDGSPIADDGFYAGDALPPTSARMAAYAEHAPRLACAAAKALGEVALEGITHLIVASCTGFTAPGLDQQLVTRLRLSPRVERTLVGFMGCYAAVNALRLAHHIVRSEPAARVLVVTVELSTLHLQDSRDLESLLAMMLFADGAAAALVTAAQPGTQGIALTGFSSHALPDSAALIGWKIGDQGFQMHLSGEVPGCIGNALRDAALCRTLAGGAVADVAHWAVHAGGRSILDAVQHGLGLDADALEVSRAVLRDHGNMSSATLMFVLARLIEARAQGKGAAMAFGPGLALEAFCFEGRF